MGGMGGFGGYGYGGGGGLLGMGLGTIGTLLFWVLINVGIVVLAYWLNGCLALKPPSARLRRRARSTS
jgi:hypothetical protein